MLEGDSEYEDTNEDKSKYENLDEEHQQYEDGSQHNKCFNNTTRAHSEDFETLTNVLHLWVKTMNTLVVCLWEEAFA